MKKLLVPALKMTLNDTAESFKSSAAKQLRIREQDIKELRIVKQALDARKRGEICYSVHCSLLLENALAEKLLKDGKLHTEILSDPKQEPLLHGALPLRGRAVVAGFGPGGIFAAWLLAKEGYKPIVLERGKPIEERVKDVEAYWKSGLVDEESNPVFGEGGAGAFSDGKLTSRSKDRRCELVLQKLCEAGAPEEILVLAKPHVGTDKLRTVVANLRREILALGGQVLFESCLTGVVTKDGRIEKVRYKHQGRESLIDCGALVLAIGQGARDTYQTLFDSGFALAPKPFAVGLRAEHLQADIDKSQYGSAALRGKLGPAEYRLTAQAGGRGVYSFCMCPGGLVVGAASQKGQCVVNGMSNYLRNAVNANAALVAQVSPKDYGEHPLDGMRFQQKLEADAFRLGGGEGLAPACTVGDFLSGRATKSFGAVTPSFRPGVRGAALSQCLPPFITDSLRVGIGEFQKQLFAFRNPEGVLTAVESRTSAPLRILRDEGMESLSHRGVYPVGEGAGYAGGIVSAAVDGLKAAEAIISRFSQDS